MSSWRVLEILGWVVQVAAIVLLIRTAAAARSTPLRGQVAGLSCALALSLAWAWRLVYQFVLASSGFWYFVPDDPCRWLLAWGWSQEPYLITWDGIWQAGTFYLHGLVMRLADDPLIASKFVSALYPMIALVGAFLFAYGIYRDWTVGLLTAVFLAPWWFHVLLGTGTMTEMPTAGLLLAGAGLLAMAVRSEERRRWRFLLLAAVAFSAATAFHIVAWMILAAILGSLLVYAVTAGRREGFGLPTWIGFSMLSTAYCWIWTIGCWLKFGDPLHFLRQYSELNRQFSDATTLAERLLVYPVALFESVAGFLPLVLFGAIAGCVKRNDERDRVRFAVAVILGALAVLALSSAVGSAGGYPLRATATLSAALVPISLAPLRSLIGRDDPGRRPGLERGRKWRLAIPAVIALTWFLTNHVKIFEFQRSGSPIDADGIALGTWLRQEIVQPRDLDAAATGPPLRLWLAEPALYASLAIQYSTGFPGRFEEWKDPAGPGVATMRPGQHLISDRPLDEPTLVPRRRYGRFTVYRFEPTAPPPAPTR